jgi:hypothetical protein
VSALEPAKSPLRMRAASTIDAESGDLFAAKPTPKRSPAARRRRAPELTAARVLCNQLRRKRALPEKKRIVHLICLNLLAILNRPSQQA